MTLKKTLLYLMAIALVMLPVAADAVTLTVTDDSGAQGATVNVDVTVDDPSEIAGATFTITYDNTVLTLTDIQSTFFDTFENQWVEFSTTPYPPNSVNVGGDDYFQPLLSNEVSTGVSVAAARCDDGAVQTTMFSLEFTIDGAAPCGDYPITIEQTFIDNETAGYPVGGEYLPMLIGTDKDETDLSIAFPLITVDDTVEGTVTVTGCDTDNDGIPDDWEIAKFGDLTTANDVTDNDGDGYTDWQEWYNEFNSILDPLSAAFDPLVPNEPGGTGYELTEMAVDFDSGGLWHFNGVDTWSQLTGLNPEAMASIGNTLYADFGLGQAIEGLWKRTGLGGSWVQVNAFDAQQMYVIGTELFVNFGTHQTLQGYWRYDGSLWHWVTSQIPENVVPLDSDQVVDFGANGLWLLTSGGTWTWMTAGNADVMGSTETGTPTLYVSFASGPSGFWSYSGSWTWVTGLQPADMVIIGEKIYTELSTDIWKYDSGLWSFLTGLDPDSMVAFGSELLCDFGSLQALQYLWAFNDEYTSGNWYQIKNAAPDFFASVGTKLVEELAGDFERHVTKATWQSIVNSTLNGGTLPGPAAGAVKCDLE